MIRSLSTIVALGALLAACGQAEEKQAAAPAKPVASGPDYVAAIRTMAPPLRRATFLRAVRDAQQPCQDVVAEQETKPVNGQASWIAQCEDGSGFVIAVQPDGNAKVMNALKPVPTRR